MIPPKLVERREELTAHIQARRNDIWFHEEALKATQAEIIELEVRLGDLDFAISAYEEASGDAVGAETASEATMAPETSNTAPAASARTRAPKRPIQQMVLEDVERHGRSTPRDIAESLHVPERAVHAAIAHWRMKGRLALNTDGTIRLAELEPDHRPGQNIKGSDGGPLPGEIVSQGEVEVQDMGYLHPAMEAQSTERSPEPLTLVEFLRATPDSTIAELHAAGFPAPDVWRAQTAGIVTGRKVGDGATVLYSLAETEGQAEAAE